MLKRGEKVNSTSLSGTAYAKAFPFEKPVEGMTHPRMIDDTVEIIPRAVNMEKRIVVIVSNRAEGPLIARKLLRKSYCLTVTEFSGATKKH